MLASLAAACSPPAAAPPPAAQNTVRVTDVNVGRSLAPDKQIADKTDSFKPAETIYVSIKTEGSAPSATLKARWIYGEDQLVQESSQTIAPNQTAVTEFHVSKPGGWPAGSYKVEVSLDGSPVKTETFKVG
jgi:hypothetical protein